MRRGKNSNLETFICLIVFCLTVASINISCNKKTPDLLAGTYPPQNVFGEQRGRVLFIVADGVMGSVLQSIAPPEINALSDHALYTYFGLADNGNDTLSLARAWANEMTGVKQSKHLVNSDFSDNNLSRYPSFSDLIKSSDSSLKVMSSVTDKQFSDYFITNADINQVFPDNDDNAVDATVKYIKDKDPDLLVTQLSSAKTVGDKYGYTGSEYRDALLKFDGYIKTLVTALKSRPKYQQENWLIVITSSMGAPSAGGTLSLFDDSSRNVFTMYYNERFNSSLVLKPAATAVPFEGFAPEFTYNRNNQAYGRMDNSDGFNMKGDGGMTFQIFVKYVNNKSTGNLRPSIFSKRSTLFSTNGWGFYLTGTNWGFASSLTPECISTGMNVTNNQWHVLTAVLTHHEGVSVAKVYTDGVFNTMTTRTDPNAEITNDEPIVIGYNPGSSATDPILMECNVQIYDTALSDDDIAKIAPLTVIDSTHPFYNNLLGYWPCNEVDQSLIKERTGHLGGGLDFELAGPYTWEEFSEVSSFLKPPILPSFYQQVPNSLDVAFEIFQWMGVAVQPEWQLDGRTWNPGYSDMVQ